MAAALSPDPPADKQNSLVRDARRSSRDEEKIESAGEPADAHRDEFADLSPVRISQSGNHPMPSLQYEPTLKPEVEEAQPNSQDDSKHECEPRDEPIDENTKGSTSRMPSTNDLMASGASTPEPRQLPSLPYSLRDHKLSIAIIWTLLIIDTAIIPIALFYPLWYATTEQPWVIFAITTSAFGLISGAEWVYRSWKLWKDENVRPIGSMRRWEFDFFHISYTLGYGLALLELIAGASPNYPIIRLCALPTPTFVLFFGLLLLTFSFCTHTGRSAPFKISSQPKGALVRPCVYMITEDVIAVDTGSGRRYRKAISERYEASPDFRRLLRHMDLFWGIPATLVGTTCFIAILNGEVPEVVAYGIGWGVPPVWAGIWAVITMKWVQKALQKEAKAWDAAYKEENLV